MNEPRQHRRNLKIISSNSGASGPLPTPSARRLPDPVVFTRQELSQILNVYGQFVAAGEWRDYAIDCLRDVAVFSVFRRASEAPLYRIEKHPRLARKQGAWLVRSAAGGNLRRGQDLDQVLRVFDRQRLKLATG